MSPPYRLDAPRNGQIIGRFVAFLRLKNERHQEKVGRSLLGMPNRPRVGNWTIVVV